MLILIEFALTLIALALAFAWPNLGSRWFGIAEQKLAALARRRRLAVLVVGLAALAARAAVLPILPVPHPRVEDEFSYLLAADTFAHGRLTNPTPPMWKHFETLHVIMRPTYQSKFPPAQGLVLAFGERLAHQPFVGVWLSVGAMCAAICWMLQGWLPPGWAFLGGWLAVIRFGIFGYWANSYFGGAVAATGGALLLGALPRILESARVRDPILMGIGLAILANSRPYEGLVLSLPVAFVLLHWLLRRKGREVGVALRRVVLPLALVLAVTGAGMGYYFWRVTGSALRMPYQVYEKTYDPVPLFLFQSPRSTPAYRQAAMRDLYMRNLLPAFESTNSLGGLLGIYSANATRMWFFLLGPALSLPLLMLPCTLPYGFSVWHLGWRARFLLCASAVSLGCFAVEFYGQAHYAAPMTCLILAVVLYSMRRIRRWRWKGKPSGLFAMRAVPLVCLLMLLLRAGAAPLKIPLGPHGVLTWYGPRYAPTERDRIRAELDKFPGQQLVLVRYNPQSDQHRWRHEWVYNGAEIDNQKIVWAWDMGHPENEELIHYFRGRQVWLIDLTKRTPKLSPYPVPALGEEDHGHASPRPVSGSFDPLAAKSIRSDSACPPLTSLASR